MKTQNYTLTPDGGKATAALAKFCAQGEIGESLLRSGMNQSAFTLFVAKLAKRAFDAGRTPEQTAEILSLVCACNASQAKQALEKCSIEWEGDEKKQSVADYWIKLGGAKGPLNLSALSDL